MKSLITLPLLILFISCSQNNSSNAVSADQPSTPEQTITSFLKWYSTHYTTIANDLVLNNNDSPRDSTKTYRVDFNATEKYLKTLTETGMISNKYADKWRAYFKDADKTLLQDPEYDGPPEGFDYDFITWSQEDPGLDQLDKLKFETTSNNDTTAVITVIFESGFKYNYYLSLYDQKWMIDNIEPLFD